MPKQLARSRRQKNSERCNRGKEPTRGVWGAQAGHAESQISLRRPLVASAAGKKPSVCLFWKVELANAASIFLGARKKQIWEATSWKKVRGTSKSGLFRNVGPWYNAPKLAGLENGRWQNDQYERRVPEDVQNHGSDVPEKLLAKMGKGVALCSDACLAQGQPVSLHS